jgi:hypothetical protein
MITAHPLLPDLSATVEVDPVECLLESEVPGEEPRAGATAEEALAHANRRTEALGKLEAYRAEADKCFKFLVGYIPPSKMTAIRFSISKYAKEATKLESKGEDGNNQFGERLVDVHREACRFGIKGWTIGDAVFPVEKVQQGGREISVAAQSLIDQLELRGWLFALGGFVLEYNTLSDQKKRP